jgi:lipopolysaccharide export system permease protein
MKIIKSYLSKETTHSILLVMAGLLAMFSFFDLLQELDSIGKGSYGIGKIILFVLLSSPGHIYEVVPVAVLIGTMYSLATMARNSELVIMRVSGMSILKIGSSLIKVGLIFALITFIVGELVTPYSEKIAQRLRIKATDSVIAQDFRSGFWVKDGNSFVNVEEVLPDAELVNIHIYKFNDNFELQTINNAKSGKFNGESWDLKSVRQTDLSATQVKSKSFEFINWQSLIRPELLNILLVVPEKMSAWNLYSYINHLSKNKQKTSRYEIALWAKIIYPIACAVMILIALPFGFLQQRAGGVGAKIFAGIILGILYQVMNRVFVHLGLLNDWSAFTSAMMPTFIFMIGGVCMLVWVESQ